jgi:Na+/proline symporter
VALGLAFANSQSVFSLVIMSWSALASAFAPLLIVQCLGRRPPQAWSLAALFLGLGVALGWRAMGWEAHVYEGMPGILAGLVLLLAVTPRSGRQPSVCS